MKQRKTFIVRQINNVSCHDDLYLPMILLMMMISMMSMIESNYHGSSSYIDIDELSYTICIHLKEELWIIHGANIVHCQERERG